MKKQKWKMNEEEKKRLIAVLAKELVPLRVKAGISQGELASVLGVSRQTYGSIERGDRKMTWNTFLSIVLFFDYNRKTHREIRNIGAFPQEMFVRFNDGALTETVGLDALIGGVQGLAEKLDEEAMRTLRTVLLLEYARCTKTPGETVVRAFDGVDFVPLGTSAGAEETPAVKRRGRPPKKH
ncbi:MAG: helix-turn-helix domain-containing protein [Clostridia bacterium]|nr:helix-turn-helix domain-containing protein [Clostridia bacterium]